jgi:hypothetical protein
MEIYRAIELDATLGRTHPWTTSMHDVNCRYYDFKRNPELITTVLEGFVPWAGYCAIQIFYDMLRWINGPASELESNDCAFSGIEQNITPRFAEKKQVSGRLMLFYRMHHRNCSHNSVQRLMDFFESHLKEVATDLKLGVVGLAKAPTLFTAINRLGQSLVLHFWGWGNTDDEVMENLSRVFAAMLEAAERTSKAIALPSS